MSKIVKPFSLSILLLLAGGQVLAGGVEQLFSVPADQIDSKSRIVPNVILVAFDEKSSLQQRFELIQNYGLEVDNRSNSKYFTRLLIPQGIVGRSLTQDDFILSLSRESIVKYAESDRFIYPEQVPTDPNFASQWSLNNTGQTSGTFDADVDAVEAWLNLDNNLAPVIVAVCDDGIDTAHPDLAANIWVNTGEIAGNGIDDDANGFIDDNKGWDFASNDNVTIPPSGSTHGTHVAGIIGMVRNNGIGGAGAGENVKVMPLRMYDQTSAWMSNLANSIDYARVNGAKVVSVSYNIDGYTTTLQNAIVRCALNDVIYCNSAGNNGQNIDTLRGTLTVGNSHVVFIANSTHTDTISSSSNYGTTVDLAAPGTNIYSTYPNNTYATISGTSMATPLAAAILASIRQKNPSLTAAQTIAVAKATADPMVALTVPLNGGRINFARGLDPLDTVSPAPILNFAIDRKSATVARVSWLATGDDGTVGNAASYEIRFSPVPITDANFSAATLGASVAGGVSYGTPMSASVRGLTGGQIYYIAIRASDDFARTSPVASAGPVTTSAPRWKDDHEAITSNWTSATWTRITGTAAGESKMWTDTATGNYANNSDTNMVMVNPVSVAGPAYFKFRVRGALETNYDFLTLEATTNNGASWTTLWRNSSLLSTWTQQSASLLPFAGQSVKLRFRLQTDSSQIADGVYLDDFSIIDAQIVGQDFVSAAGWFTPGGTGLFSRTTTVFQTGPEAWIDTLTGSPAAGADNWIESSELNTAEVADPSIAFWLRANLALSDTFTTQSRNSTGTFVQTQRYWGRNLDWVHHLSPIDSKSNAKIAFRLKSASTSPGDGVVLDDFSLIGEAFKTGISGTLVPQGAIGTVFSGPNARPFSLAVTSGSSTFNYALAPATNGAFALDCDQSGLVSIRVSAPGWLSKRVSGITLSATTQVGAVILTGGDIDLDNEIGPGDFDAVVAAFGTSTGNPGFNQYADLDFDGEVGPADFDMVVANFGLQGD